MYFLFHSFFPSSVQLKSDEFAQKIKSCINISSIGMDRNLILENNFASNLFESLLICHHFTIITIFRLSFIFFLLHFTVWLYGCSEILSIHCRCDFVWNKTGKLSFFTFLSSLLLIIWYREWKSALIVTINFFSFQISR